MWMALKEELTGLLFPHKGQCPLCQKNKAREICSYCEMEINTLIGQEFCRKCGKIIENSNSVICRDCLNLVHNYVLARAVGPYAGIFRDSVWRLKYEGYRPLAPIMGRYMADVIINEQRIPGIDLIVPVPLSIGKLCQRRFNQAELLARSLAKLIGLNVHPRLLERIIDTPAQAKMERRERIANMRGAFRVTRPEEVFNKRVILVDDVLTTGATANECSRILMEAGARGVYIITWATGKQM